MLKRCNLQIIDFSICMSFADTKIEFFVFNLRMDYENFPNCKFYTMVYHINIYFLYFLNVIVMYFAFLHLFLMELQLMPSNLSNFMNHVVYKFIFLIF